MSLLIHTSNYYGDLIMWTYIFEILRKISAVCQVRKVDYQALLPPKYFLNQFPCCISAVTLVQGDILSFLPAPPPSPPALLLWHLHVQPWGRFTVLSLITLLLTGEPLPRLVPAPSPSSPLPLSCLLARGTPARVAFFQFFCSPWPTPILAPCICCSLSGTFLPSLHLPSPHYACWCLSDLSVLSTSAISPEESSLIAPSSSPPLHTLVTLFPFPWLPNCCLQLHTCGLYHCYPSPSTGWGQGPCPFSSSFLCHGYILKIIWRFAWVRHWNIFWRKEGKEGKRKGNNEDLLFCYLKIKKKIKS